jgi:hypothetical protein
MKKIFIIAFCVVTGVLNSTAQTMQASIGPGTTSVRIKIYVSPITAVNGNISTFQFNVAIPAGVLPAPSLAFVGVPAFGSGWVITPPYVEDGFRHYEIVSSTGGPLVLGAGGELEVMELEFSGGPGGFSSNGVGLYTLPFGGATGNALFLCTGAANSIEGQLYYNRGGVILVNNNTYSGGPPSSATIGGVLPVTFSSYDVRCIDKGAMLTWTTVSEQNSDRFEIQRSENSVDWTTIEKVTAAGNSSDIRNYEYLDLKGGLSFYRIRQVDMDGRFIYTNIRRTDCKAGQFDVVLYPVPAKDKLTVVIKADKAVRTDLQITDVLGKVIRSIPTQITSGNNTINLNVANLPAGQYILVSSDATLQLNKKFTILR